MWLAGRHSASYRQNSNEKAGGSRLPGPHSDHSAKPRCLSQDLEPLFRDTILYPSLSKDLPALSSMHRSHYMLKTFQSQQSQAVGRLPRKAEQSPSLEALKTRQGKTLINLAWSSSRFCFGGWTEDLLRSLPAWHALFYEVDTFCDNITSFPLFHSLTFIFFSCFFLQVLWPKPVLWQAYLSATPALYQHKEINRIPYNVLSGEINLM